MKSGSALVITLVVAGLLLAGGAAAYVATDGFGGQESQDVTSQQESSEEVEAETEAEANESESPTTLIRNALEGGDAVACTFMQNGHAGSAFITSDNNFRVDAESDEGMAHMIKQGDSAYMWVEGESEGFEFSGEAYNENFDENFDSFNPEEFEESAEASNVADIDCERAQMDQDRFELPDNVNFQSWADLMQGATQN